MNEYDLDTEEMFTNPHKEIKIIIKKISNGFLMNTGSGYSFYLATDHIIQRLETDLKRLEKL